jgi:ABC-type nickel/cobalt efflux system permease component RcnA
MGNFSISHFAALRIETGSVELRYILDLAEIPTFQEMQAAGIISTPEDPRVAAYLARKAEALKGALVVTLNGRPLALETISENVIFPSGAGNLPTMKIGVVFRAPLGGAVCPCTLDYRDGNFPERAGWKEVVATAGPGLNLHSSTAAAISRSQELANYPTDLINSPPQDLSARLIFGFTTPPAAGGPANALAGSSGSRISGATPTEGGTPSAQTTRKPMSPAPVTAMGTLTPNPGRTEPLLARAGKPEKGRDGIRLANQASPASAPAAMPAAASAQKLALEANKQGTPRNRFTELIASNQWGLWFVLTAALIAAALGGLHALEPGHGKTIVAAYLVGSQGKAVHALLLGLIVTVTHTAGVYALGLITLYASKYIVPDHLYPWLGISSGLTIALLGLYMLGRRYAGHGHTHGHHHHSGPFGHSHDHELVPPHEHYHHPGLSHQLTNDLPGHGGAPALPPAHAHEHHHHDHQGPGHSHGEHSLFSHRQLVMLGVTGGIIPCPAALVVLLSAIALHRVAFGLYLIVAFSLGLAIVLISIGLVTVYARRLLSQIPSDGPLVNRWLPMASATVITCLGVGIAAQALLTLGVIHVRW